MDASVMVTKMEALARDDEEQSERDAEARSFCAPSSSLHAAGGGMRRTATSLSCGQLRQYEKALDDGAVRVKDRATGARGDRATRGRKVPAAHRPAPVKV